MVTNPLKRKSHPLAGETVTIQKGKYKGCEYRVEDYWDKLTGGSWGCAQGNPACLMYAARTIGTDIPMDDEVLYGKIGLLGHLVHVSEL